MFDKTAYQREYMRRRRAVKKSVAPKPAPISSAASDRREYMRDYQRRRRAADAGKADTPERQRKREVREAEAAAKHEARMRENAERIIQHMRDHMGGVCCGPSEIRSVVVALDLGPTEWTPAILYLQSQGRVRWGPKASILDDNRLILSEMAC